MDELRARTDLPALLSRSTKLSRAGRDWRGCCPFHDEKTPSFYVYADHYHCFGCGAHGDAVRWLTDKQGLAFPDAVRELAGAAGLDVPEESREAKAKAERQAGLREPLAAAAEWFAARLWSADGAEARAYLTRRGVTPETARAFGLGYAPDARTGLARALAEAGEARLVEAGLAIAPEGGGPAFDRFRARLIFPIRDARGRTVGFGGRALGDVQPKYLNSPDTPLFDKGRLLWNLDRAAAPARAASRLFLVEGYMDGVALTQAGIAEVAAPMGTALSEAQLALAWRLVPEPTLCFDGDRAGLAAAGKAARRALPGIAPGRSLRFMTLPPGQDPDDVVRAGGRAAVEALAADAEPLHAFLWRTMLATADVTSPEGRAGLKAELNAAAAEIADRDVRAEYEAEFRNRFWQHFGWRKGGAPFPPAPAPARRVRRAVECEAHAAIAGALLWPDVAGEHLDALGAIPTADASLLRLRGALVDALMWEPECDAAALAAYLARSGHTADAERIAATCPLHFTFTRARPYPRGPGEDDAGHALRAAVTERRARTQLAALIEALAWLETNHVALLAARRKHLELHRLADEAPQLQARRAFLFDRIRALQQARRAHYEALAAFAQDAGADPDLGVRAVTTKAGEEQDGEKRGGSGGGGTRSGDEGRRAAHRSERSVDQEDDRERQEARLHHL